ncbi:hypothetical protein MN0502_20280 [Arthrobacter sp. MN05-02]|nr:hypothetical protein MN0502_20280 [Arthrobacter sp. MN05-02]
MKEFATLAQFRLSSTGGNELDHKTALLLLLALPRAIGEDGWQNQP